MGAAALVAVGPEEPLGSALLLPIVAAPGVALVAMAVVQLARREGRARLTASMTFGVTTAVLAVTLALWLAPWSDPEGTAVLLIALSGAATAAAFALFPSPRLLWVVGGSIAAAGAGLLVQASAQHVYDAGVDPLAAAAVAAGAGAGAAGRLWVARLVMTDEGLDGSAGTLVRTARTSGLLTAALPMACAAPPTLAAAWLVLA